MQEVMQRIDADKHSTDNRLRNFFRGVSRGFVLDDDLASVVPITPGRMWSVSRYTESLLLSCGQETLTAAKVAADKKLKNFFITFSVTRFLKIQIPFER